MNFLEGNSQMTNLISCNNLTHFYFVTHAPCFYAHAIVNPQPPKNKSLGHILYAYVHNLKYIHI